MALQEKYARTIAPELIKTLQLKNIHQVPKITRITLNVGVGRLLKEPDAIGVVEESLQRISGQKPVRTKAKKSIAAFKVRAGQVVGVSVTLRKKRMYDFLEKLLTVVLPRVRDFRGLDAASVDAQGNLSIGFRENIAFPEIRSDEIERIHGLEVNIATSAADRESGIALFTALGFPFKKESLKKTK